MTTLANRAGQVCQDIGERLADVGRIKAVMGTARMHLVLPGCAMLAARRGSTGLAVTHIQELVAQLPAYPSNLYQGTTGAITAALVVQSMTQDPQLTAIAQAGIARLEERTVELVQRYWTGRAHGMRGTPGEIFDAVDGLAGLGRILLLGRQSGFADTERALRSALEVLTDMLSRDADGIPGWWQPPNPQLAGSAASPGDISGQARTGMAHGMSGPLSLLSLASDGGISVDGQHDAIWKGAVWLMTWRNPETGTWPIALTGDELRYGYAPPPRHAFYEWCVGAAGITHALGLASRVLRDPLLAQPMAHLLTLFDRIPPSQWGITGPIVCCGYAGVLQAIMAARAVLPGPSVDHAADCAAEAILACWEPHTPFGFPRHAGGVRVDSAELLYGASGIALTLHDYADGVNTSWPSILLLQ